MNCTYYNMIPLTLARGFCNSTEGVWLGKKIKLKTNKKKNGLQTAFMWLSRAR